MPEMRMRETTQGRHPLKPHQRALAWARNRLPRHARTAILDEARTSLEARTANPKHGLEKWEKGFTEWKDFYSCWESLKKRYKDNLHLAVRLEGKYRLPGERADLNEFDSRIRGEEIVVVKRDRPGSLKEMHKFLFGPKVLGELETQEKALLERLKGKPLKPAHA